MVRAAAILAPLAMLAAAPAPASLLDYVGQCVPFARAASGIDLYGDAWTWWDKAQGRYRRGATPWIGAVIVFAKTQRLVFGHVAVVSRVVDPRVLMLTHANWSRLDGERGHAEQDVTLRDVSRENDWSEVRVWYRDMAGLGGGTYPVKGFIYGEGRPPAGLSSRRPDYVGALIDSYVGLTDRQSRAVAAKADDVPSFPRRAAERGAARRPQGASAAAGSASRGRDR